MGFSKHYCTASQQTMAKQSMRKQHVSECTTSTKVCCLGGNTRAYDSDETDEVTHINRRVTSLAHCDYLLAFVVKEQSRKRMCVQLTKTRILLLCYVLRCRICSVLLL